MPVIPATQEAEIRRIMVPGWPKQKEFVRLHLNRKKAGHSDGYLASTRPCVQTQ
jgi:hypothetical protein